MINSKITVLLPVYNGEKYLRKSIESILNQTFKDFTFLIIDDKSTDDSIKIINSYIDKFEKNQIKLLQNKQNIGLTKTLNKGIEFSNSKYIARIDQDDEAYNDRLQIQHEYLTKNPDVCLLGSNCHIIDSNDKLIGEWTTKTDRKSIANLVYKKNPFAHSSVIFDRIKIKDLGSYPNHFFYAQDFALWIKVMSKYNFANIDIPLNKIRKHKDQVTMNKNLTWLKAKEELKIAKSSIILPNLLFSTRLNLIIKIIKLYLALSFQLIKSNIFKETGQNV